MKENYFMGMDGFVWFTGVVEDRNDPSKLGRVKVRCLGLHTESLVDIPTKDLPWAHIMQSTNNPSMQGLGNTPSFLVEGTWVVGFFLDAVEKQQPLIMGTLPGIPQAVADKTKGFNDPNGTYPSEKITHSNHAIEESDVNRLARNDTDKAHAVVDKKDSSENRTTEVATANSSTTWNEPASAYAASYPKNHVLETESGHIKEYDDTSGQERIHEYHTKGTFYEIDKDGNKSTRIVGDNYEVIAGSDFVNIKGSANLTIDSNCNTYIKGNWNIQVDGTKTEVVTGAVSETYKSTKTENVTGAVQETFSATQTTNVSSNVTITGSRIDLN
tara:strand:+ start:262 stop:1245 length:984 start_codon:yes stop_codon:yes gene_type:complete